MPVMVAAGFQNLDEVEAVISELARLGYDTKDFALIAAESHGAVLEQVERQHLEHHTVGEGAASGAAAGTILGGLAGLLSGAGVLPMIGGLLFGGPAALAIGATGVMATTISGVVTGAATGSLIGALTHVGVSDEAARSHHDTIAAGGVMLGVPISDDDAGEMVREVFSEHGAHDLSEIDLEEID